MGHFAKVLNGKVINVIRAEPDFFATFVDSSPGEWIQTSYNTRGNQHPEGAPLRGNYAGVGYTYDPISDVFYEPQPYPSWVLSPITVLWEAPVPYPTGDKTYEWDESTTAWIEKV